MTEIRPIEPNEAEAFLTLLCDVFSLDVARARGIFFSEPLFDIRRKWALFEDGRLVSILTTVPLEFGWGNAIGIAGVATRPELRGRGRAGKLLEAVFDECGLRGESAAFLFARDPRVYMSKGFEVLDEAVYATLRNDPKSCPGAALDFEEIQRRYESWANACPNRLRRSEKRWNYWKWNFRVCNALQTGYVCIEGNLVRECVIDEPATCWPVGPSKEWFGLASMARLIGAPISSPRRELYLMGKGARQLPEMFLTDQF